MNGRSALPQARWRDPTRRPGLIQNVSRGLAAVFAVSLLLFLLLEVNDTVSVQNATIVTKPQRVVHEAPYPATVAEVRVTEGDRVHPTDTLLKLASPTVESEYRSARERYEGLQSRLQIINDRLQNTRDRLEAVQAQMDARAKLVHSDTLIKKRSLRGLEARLDAARMQEQLARNEFRRDSLLYEKDLLEEAAYENSRRSWLKTKQTVAQLRSELETTQVERNRATLDWKNRKLRLQEEVLNTRAELLQLRQTRQDLKTDLRRQKNTLEAQQHQYEQRIVTADLNGVVQTLYDSEEQVEHLQAGDVLAVVTPVEDSLHVRLQLQQSSIDKVRVGQTVHLKIDPYNHYKYGVVKGRIQRLEAPGGPQEPFYAIASIHTVPEGITIKPGYEASADIIRQEMPMYAYALRYILQQFEQG